MNFLNQVIETTKESNKKYKMERAEYERASNVLYDIAERKLKKCVLQRAKDGYTDATFDVIDDLKLDIAGKWSIPELLFTIIFEDAPPVVSRLFYLSNSPFDGFAISTKEKGTGPPSTFVLDWAYAMLKPQNTIPAKPPAAPTARAQTSLSRDLGDYFSAAAVEQGNFPQQSTPPTKPNVQIPPGAPVKPANPIVRDLFSNTSLPLVTDQQIMDYLAAIYGMANYPK
jgi:hypothetical protein